MGITEVLAGIGTVEKIIPVIEAVSKEIGPVIETEIKDGEAVWAGVQKAIEDFKTAIAALKIQISGAVTPGKPPTA